MNATGSTYNCICVSFRTPCFDSVFVIFLLLKFHIILWFNLIIFRCCSCCLDILIRFDRKATRARIEIHDRLWILSLWACQIRLNNSSISLFHGLRVSWEALSHLHIYCVNGQWWTNGQNQWWATLHVFPRQNITQNTVLHWKSPNST